MKQLWWGLAMLVMLCAADVAWSKSVRKTMEASMLVDGEIVVDAQGKVAHYELDHRDRLPDGVQRFIDANIAGWRFEPTQVDGHPAVIRNRMGLLLVAMPRGDGDFRMELRSASFYPMQDAGYEVEQITMTPPSYPRFAAENGVSGTVYLAIRLDADGDVVEAMAEQVNLRIARSEPEMRRWRNELARNAIEAARKWTFRLPTKGQYAGADSWDMRVPVAYSLHDFGADPELTARESYGKWQAYMPGPRQPIPWQAGADDVPLEALASGGLYPVVQNAAGRLKLAPPTGGG